MQRLGLVNLSTKHYVTNYLHNTSSCPTLITHKTPLSPQQMLHNHHTIAIPNRTKGPILKGKGVTCMHTSLSWRNMSHNGEEGVGQVGCCSSVPHRRGAGPARRSHTLPPGSFKENMQGRSQSVSFWNSGARNPKKSSRKNYLMQAETQVKMVGIRKGTLNKTRQ